MTHPKGGGARHSRTDGKRANERRRIDGIFILTKKYHVWNHTFCFDFVKSVKRNMVGNYTFTFGQSEEYSLESLTDKRITEDLPNAQSAVLKATAPHVLLAQVQAEGRISNDRNLVKLLVHGCRIARELKATETMTLEAQMPLVLRALRFCRSSAFQENEHQRPEFGRTYKVPKVVFSLVHGTMLDNWMLLARFRTIEAVDLLPRKERKFMMGIPKELSEPISTDAAKPKTPTRKKSDHKPTQAGKTPKTGKPPVYRHDGRDGLTLESSAQPAQQVTVTRARAKSLGTQAVGNTASAPTLPTGLPIPVAPRPPTTPPLAPKNRQPKSNRRNRKKKKVRLLAGDTVANADKQSRGNVGPSNTGITTKDVTPNLDVRPRAPKALQSVYNRSQQQWDAALVMSGLHPDPIPFVTSTQVSTQSSAPTLETIENVSGSSRGLEPNREVPFDHMPPIEKIDEEDKPGNKSIFVEGLGFQNDSWNSSNSPTNAHEAKIVGDGIGSLSESFDSVLALSPGANTPIQFVNRAAAAKRKMSSVSTASPSPIIERQISVLQVKPRSTTKTPGSGRKKNGRRKSKRRKT